VATEVQVFVLIRELHSCK